MTTRLYTDRTRYEDGLRCARLRYLGHHFGGMGIRSAKTPLPLAVGGSVHEGLAELLRQSMLSPTGLTSALIEEDAVRAALADFAQYKNQVEVDTGELAAQTPIPSLEGMLAESVGAAAPDLAGRMQSARSAFDDYLWQEQSALVEALVRAYSRRRLRPLLEQFEVLEVEREGEWLLSDLDGIPGAEIWFMSRPDALLRERDSNALYLLSYKTAASWDIRKARDAEHDMQGMSEGIEVERRLDTWWRGLHNIPVQRQIECPPGNERTVAYLRTCDAPPRILGVRYEYMLKSYRGKDKELSAQLEMECWTQRSHLIRAYEAVSVPQRGTAGYSIGDKCWSWDYLGEDGRSHSLAWQNWKSRPVWNDLDGVKRWIDKLDTAAPAMSAEDPTVGMEPRLLGYACDAQAVGYTAEHPLDAVFIPPVTVYRNEDELRDLVEQMEAVERRVAEGVAAVNGASDADEVRSALNVHFPMTRRACEYPTTCSCSKICYGGEDMRRDPLGSGLYKVREPNHPQELGDASKG